MNRVKGGNKIQGNSKETGKKPRLAIIKLENIAVNKIAFDAKTGRVKNPTMLINDKSRRGTPNLKLRFLKFFLKCIFLRILASAASVSFSSISNSLLFVQIIDQKMMFIFFSAIDSASMPIIVQENPIIKDTSISRIFSKFSQKNINLIKIKE